MFLSHLCGGEHGIILDILCLSFLSHLCGGEPLALSSSLITDFLSHLCGGEQYFKYKKICCNKDLKKKQ